jgi:hypothetical protein
VASQAARYWRFVFFVLVRKAEAFQSESKLSGPRVTYQNCVSTCLDIFRTKDILGTHVSSRTSAVESVFAGFLLLLQDCDDCAIASELLEILSLLALSEEGLLDQLLIASWKSLHTVYTTRSADKESRLVSPYAFARALHKFLEQESSKSLKTIELCFEDTVLRPWGSNTRELGNTLRHHLLRHWGVFVLAPSLYEIGINHLIEFYEELSFLVESVFDSVATRQDEEKKEDHRRNGNGIQLTSKHHSSQSAKRKTLSSVSSIPSLTGASLAVAFETLLSIVVASMGAVSAGQPAKAHHHAEKHVVGRKESGPYWHVRSLLYIFRCLLELYEKASALFPRRVLSNILVAAKHMLNMTIVQLKACVEWRNSQPLLTVAEKSKNSYDQGSMTYLQGLVDSCWMHAAGKLLSFINNLKAQQNASTKKLKDSGDDSVEQEYNHGFLTKRNDNLNNKLSALSFTVKRVAQSIKDIASSHNLTPPDIGDIRDAEDPDETVLLQKRKTWVDANVGFHEKKNHTSQFRCIAKNIGHKDLQTGKSNKLRRFSADDGSSFGEESARGEDAVSGVSRRLRINDEREEESDGDYSFEDGRSAGTEADQDDSSSASFGATGDWGDENASQVSSSGSLTLDLETPLFQPVR